MAKVTGIGGVFFLTENSEELYEWYRKHLGIECVQYGHQFKWRDYDSPEKEHYTQWSVGDMNDTYFLPSQKPFMFNYIVDNMEEMAEQLKSNGIALLKDIDYTDHGKFAWIMGPQGEKIELWEPPHPLSKSV